MPTVLESLPSFISLTEAGKRLDLNETHLRELILAGTLKAARIQGETVVDEENVNEVASQPKREDLDEYKHFSHLKGNAIWMSKAARDYSVPLTTLYQWCKKGYIKLLGREKNRTLLNEQDVAYCALVYTRRGGQGRTLFNADGTPYSAKTEATV